MFTLQIQCGTIEDAERILAALKHSANPAVVEALAAQVNAEVEPAAITPEVEKPKNPRGRPRREVAEKPKTAAAPAVAAGAASEAGDASAPAPTLDDARAALKGVQAKYGTDDMSKPLEVLGQFSAGRISEVKSEQYPAFIAACKAA
jgi:predicted lipid-binding transport protein (Tim44 family)